MCFEQNDDSQLATQEFRKIFMYRVHDTEPLTEEHKEPHKVVVDIQLITQLCLSTTKAYVARQAKLNEHS